MKFIIKEITTSLASDLYRMIRKNEYCVVVGIQIIEGEIPKNFLEAIQHGTIFDEKKLIETLMISKLKNE